MKKNLFYIFTFLSVNLLAQVGVNTNQPTPSLDVNGDARIRTLNKVTVTYYPNILVRDEDGNIEKHSAQAIIDAISDLTLETKELYFNSSPDGTKIVPCGRFDLRFSSGTIPQIGSVSNLGIPTSVYFLGQLKKETNLFTVTQASVILQNKSSFVNLDSNYAINNIGEYYLSFPGDNNFYRVVFLARKMTDSQNSYSIVCEKF